MGQQAQGGFVEGSSAAGPLLGGGGSEGGDALGGIGVGELLPFTGAVLTLPIVILGLVLTFREWVLARLAGEQPPHAG